MTGDHNNPTQPRMRRTVIGLQAILDTPAQRDWSDRGASMVEYALLLVLVLLAAFFSVQIFGDSLVALFDTSANTIDSAPNVSP